MGTATQDEIDAIDKWRSEIAACYSNSHAFDRGNRHARYQDLSKVSTCDTTPKAKKAKAPARTGKSIGDDSEMQDES